MGRMGIRSRRLQFDSPNLPLCGGLAARAEVNLGVLKSAVAPSQYPVGVFACGCPEEIHETGVVVCMENPTSGMIEVPWTSDW